MSELTQDTTLSDAINLDLLRASAMSLGDGPPSPVADRGGGGEDQATSPAIARAAAVPGPETPPVPLVGGAVGVSPSFVNVAVEPSTSSENVHQVRFEFGVCGEGGMIYRGQGWSCSRNIK